MTSFWAEKRVLVTGGAGFVGSHLVDKLVALKADVTVADNLSRGSDSRLSQSIDRITLKTVDLSNYEMCIDACKNIDVVLNLAARVAGIQFNQTHSADMFRINSRIAMNMLEAGRVADVERFLVVSSACVYPSNSSIPTPESEGFLGDPEQTNWGYGWAKRLSEIQAKAYAEQYGMKIGIVRPYNTYGPRDHFDLGEAHVIPALIRRITDNEDPLNVWGSGKQTRSFIFVEDLVEGLLMSVERYSHAYPINIGSNEEVTIRTLVDLIQTNSKRNQSVIFDTSYPEGQSRRKPDVRKAKNLIGFEATTSINEGLRKTIGWYEQIVARAPKLEQIVNR